MINRLCAFFLWQGLCMYVLYTFLAILLELFHTPNLRRTLGKLSCALGTETSILQSKDFLRFLPHMQDLPLPKNNINLSM